MFAVPEVAPPAVAAIVLNTDWFDAEIVIVLAPCPIPMLAPAEIDRDPFEPFNDVTTFVAAGAGTEIVIEPAPTPIDAIPAPEIFRRLENVPAELDVVLPSAVIETDDVCTEAEIVIVEAACPTPIPAPAEIETLDDVPFREKFVAVGTFADTVILGLVDS